MSQPPINPRAWIERLAGLGAMGAGANQESSRTPDPRRAEHPFLAHRGVLTPHAEPANPDPDAGLWWAVLDGRRPLESLLAQQSSDARGPTDEGALFPQGLYRTIEVWTEADLSGLHALWWLGLRRERDDLLQRALVVARWHVEHVQPDNATNRPWAAHVFLALASREGSPEARLHADTLVHNCLAFGGVPEPLSAHILQDSADALRASLDRGLF